MTIPQPSTLKQERLLPMQSEERLHSALRQALVQHEARLEEHTDPDDIAALVQHRSERARAEILAALTRMEEGTYGWCQGCGQSIATDRLEVVPHTRLCASCARQG